MKLYSFFFLFGILWSTPVAFAFLDVPDSYKYAEEINLLAQKSVVNTDNTYFFPEVEIARIEFVEMLYQANLFPDLCVYDSIRFKDTELNQWYTPALRRAVLCGGMTGHDNFFRPSDSLTYAEGATIVAKISGEFFATDPWYQSGIDFLDRKDMDFSYPPAHVLTRGEAAFLLASMLDDQSFSGQKFVEIARKQKGVVTSYDSGYYSGGYPPDDTGACTDVVERALRDMGYDWKGLIDTDMRLNSWAYPSGYDSNINYRRVRNVKVFLDRYAEAVPLDAAYLPGDIVTYDQVPGGLWHIAIVSDKKSSDGTPLLIHNYATGVVENNLLHAWPAPKTGHYRLSFLGQ